MVRPDNIYKEIYDQCSAFCRKQSALEQEKENLEVRHSERMLSIEEAVKTNLQDNEEHEARLTAFMGIAKTHAGNLVDTGEIEVYETGILSRLAVQIDNASKNDYFAEQLFTHASNQLRYVKQEVNEIAVRAEQERVTANHEYSTDIENYRVENQRLAQAISLFFNSNQFTEFVEVLNSDSEYFETDHENVHLEEYFGISLGTKRVVLPIPKGYEEQIISLCKGAYDGLTHTVGIPVQLDVRNGDNLLVEYRNESEEALLSGIRNFLFNVLKYYGDEFAQILYVDPVRYNGSSLGMLQPLSFGENSVIDNVPLSMEEARKKLSAVIAQINVDERNRMNMNQVVMPKRLMIFHNFPDAYDSTMISQIQQLYANASNYNVNIIATVNLSARIYTSSSAVDFVKTMATCIGCDEEKFTIADANDTVEFRWYNAPLTLPSSITRQYIDEKPVLDTSNDYDRRIGIAQKEAYKKGIRSLENIPYGIDKNGNLQYLDFENTDFATFICGASRSGKSTLLHTLLTGFIKNNHPDDIEIWLVDFKMTEFSRYINHLPPHVRYIILDESPELVYDIIDRLTEILTKRQNIFKGKWQKLNEVPSDKYMPAILVVIDEFSVMSQIVADSVMSSKENYSFKLQTLLAKGAALGLHFIFASQGFTTGTRGLNDFSKKQIQQRIAMKTEYNEIKETLDLKSASDDDRAMMEQLPSHHALVRIPVDAKGNHLKQTEVLYISDYSKQDALIDGINRSLSTAPHYDVSNPNVYIDKKSMVIDGNKYSTFMAKYDDMLAYVNKKKAYLEGDEAFFFLGEPRRMLPLFPIDINNGYCENMLIVSPINEKMATTSVIMSIAQSLQFVNKEMDVWTHKKNEVYCQMIFESQQKVRTIAKELDEVCQDIRSIKEAIENKVVGDRYIVLLGTETLLMDMSYQSEEKSSSNDTVGQIALTDVKKRDPGALDLNSMLAILGKGEPLKSVEKESQIVEKKERTMEGIENTNRSYDARADLKFILTQGPRLGYHFILLFNTTGELNQSRLDLSLFKHKILFRLSKADASALIGSSGANVVAEMEDHTFRYTNGIESLSFRPYLHNGLSWDGWMVSGSEVINVMDEEEEYLM